jgi:hypothetical protein
MLGYMALVIRMDKTRNIDEVHTITYDEARQVVPPEEYLKLVSTLLVQKKICNRAFPISKAFTYVCG